LKCIAPKNPHSLKLAGFEVLLIFIETLQDSAEEKVFNGFATAINLPLFLEPNTKEILKYFPGKFPSKNLLENFFLTFILDADSDYSILGSPEPPSKKDALEILDFFLDFMAKSTQIIFWFNQFKLRYLSSLYPNIFQELRVLDKYDGKIFLCFNAKLLFMPS
jgi:hypothetical protein